MPVLADILYKCRIQQVIGSTALDIQGLTFDSRKATKNWLFAAIPGATVDGHDYISQATANGASAVLCEHYPEELVADVTYIQVQDSSASLGLVAANFYGNPSKSLQVIAVTGTNGKTTTCTLLFNLLRSLGESVGLLSTVVNRINDTIIDTKFTTPDSITIQELMASMVEAGCRYCFMEASSHAVHQRRTAGIESSGAVFTNITHDHLDYHKTFKDYIAAKKLLFDGLSPHAFALINEDDKHGDVMVQNCKAKVKTFGLKSMADYRGKILENQFGGLHLSIDGKDVYTKLVGGFNAYNLLTVYAVCIELGMDSLDVLTQLSRLEAVEGRFQYVQSTGNVMAVVDYAHTPDALRNVLETIKNIRTGNEKVITVVGCGGDRDRQKRPLMAQISAELSDQVILTSDNPRSEDPSSIIAEMQKGLDPVTMKKALALTDRREAIKLACTLAADGDIILVAGKGHEKYQEIKGVRQPFDDMEIVSETLKMLEK